MTRILTIDDDDLVREQVQNWFEMEGFEVFDAPSGPDGIEIALRQPVDLIVCDIAMPEMSGYDVLEELRKHPQTTTTPFIFLTAQSDKSFMRHGMELGADDYLTKPFTRPELLSAARARLRRSTAIADSYSREVDEAKTNLARLVAHELKTPLVNIHMVKEIIERQMEQLSPSEMHTLIDTLGTGTERLNHLIEQMVYVTQLDTGVLSPEAIDRNGYPIEVWQIIPGGIDLGRRFAFRNRDLNIVTDERDQQASVLAHMQALKHALAELVANALNYSPPNGQVTISQWKSNSGVYISVIDQGPGMSTREQMAVLEPFVQINRAVREQQGMGVGLTLVRRIIEAHKGELELHSMEGKGTQVTMRLPVCPPV